MDEEFDSGLEISESMSDFSEESTLDVGALMDETENISDIDEFMDFDSMEEESLDISSIMDEAALPDETEVPEEEILEDVTVEVTSDDTAVLEEEILEDVTMVDTSDEAEVIEEEILEDVTVAETADEAEVIEEEILEDVTVAEIADEAEVVEEEIIEDVTVAETADEAEVVEEEILEDVTVAEISDEAEAIEEEILEDVTVAETADEAEVIEEEILEDVTVAETADEAEVIEEEILEDVTVAETADEAEVIEEEIIEDVTVAGTDEVIEEESFEDVTVADTSEETEVTEEEILEDVTVAETADEAEVVEEENFEDVTVAETADEAEVIEEEILEDVTVAETADEAEVIAEEILENVTVEDTSAEAEVLEEVHEDATVEDIPVELPQDELAEEIPDVAAEAPETDSGSALAAMGEYLSEHNYGREDYAEYSQDPQWQKLNNDLLVELGREPIDYSESVPDVVAEAAETDSGSALAAMGEYLSEHNYGREDYGEYSQDPQWQKLNNDLLAELGREPIDYSESVPDVVTEAAETDSGSALAAMGEYLSEHNYGREDYGEYSQDPQWQKLNNDLLVELGREPIDYSESVPDVAAEAAETDSGSALAAMGEYLSEHNYGREDYAEYSQDPQWQQLNNDLLVELGREPFEYPDLPDKIESVPERVYDEFEDMVRLDDADFYEDGTFYTQGINEYHYINTCGETSMASTINRVLGTNEYTENKVLDVAVQEGLCDTESFDESGGTTTSEFMELYDRMNDICGDKLDVQLHDFENVLSMEEAAQKLEDGCTLNVAVDADTLWDLRDPMGSPLPERKATDHWITVTGVRRDPNGGIQGFDIIDSGGGENYVDADKYQAMCYGTKNLELTDPTCIVVSRKEQDVAASADAAVPEIADGTPNLGFSVKDGRVFAVDPLYEDFARYPEDSDGAFELQRLIHHPSVRKEGAE